MFKKIVFFLCFMLLGGAVLVVFAQQTESLTITTYYPSPYGSYNEMSVFSRLAIGDFNSDGKTDDQDMAVDNSGNPIPGSLTVAGRVGIGTVSPEAALDVGNGGIRLGGVTRNTWPPVTVVTATTTGNLGELAGQQTASYSVVCDNDWKRISCTTTEDAETSLISLDYFNTPPQQGCQATFRCERPEGNCCCAGAWSKVSLSITCAAP